MIDKTGNIPAFPIPLYQGQQYSEHGPADGMTLRDYFAAKAIAAFLICDGTVNFQTRAREAYEVADAMLEARGK